MTRRTLLRGAGAVVALPFLEAMQPRSLLRAQEPPAAAAKRLVCIYSGFGVYNDAWYPKETGFQYALSPTLESLRNVRSYVSVIAGLHHPASPSRHPCQGTWLIGCDWQRGSGISMDQIVAEEFRRMIRIPSIQMGRQGKLGEISWTRTGVPLPSVNSPEAIYTRLFGEEDASDIQAARRRLREKRSVLDLVREDAHRVQRSLGQEDKARLDQYFSSVREVEGMVEQAEKFIDRPRPKVDPAVLECDQPSPAAYFRVMFDLLYLALKTDSTRIVTWIAGAESNGIAYTNLGHKEKHHWHSHHSHNEDVKIKGLGEIDAYRISELARFLEKLKGSGEADGNLLDRTLVLYGKAYLL
jgi:hypothetical protein